MYCSNYQQMNYMGNPYLQPQMQIQGLKGRQVSSVEEVRAAQIDFDGSLFIFPDVANKKFYTKQIALDGTPSIKVYNLVEDNTPAPSFVTKEELDSIIENLKESLKDESRTTKTSNSNPAISF